MLTLPSRDDSTVPLAPTAWQRTLEGPSRRRSSASLHQWQEAFGSVPALRWGAHWQHWGNVRRDARRPKTWARDCNEPDRTRVPLRPSGQGQREAYAMNHDRGRRREALPVDGNLTLDGPIDLCSGDWPVTSWEPKRQPKDWPTTRRPLGRGQGALGSEWQGAVI